MEIHKQKASEHVRSEAFVTPVQESAGVQVIFEAQAFYYSEEHIWPAKTFQMREGDLQILLPPSNRGERFDSFPFSCCQQRNRLTFVIEPDAHTLNMLNHIRVANILENGQVNCVGQE